MGAVYKNKRRACGLCKPHKRGISDKHTKKNRQEIIHAQTEIRGARLRVDHRAW